MSKYVIKNCPACRQYNVFGVDDKPCCYSDMKYCQDCTDCVMKKIVEKCREAQEIMDKEEYYEDDFDTFNGESIMAETIMDILEIQECE